MKAIFLAGCFVLAAIGARAESAETTADLRCFIASNVTTARTKEPAAAAALRVAGMYYLGRLDGSAPGLDLKKRYAEERAKMSAEDISAEDQRCGKILVERGAAIMQMAQDMKKPPS